MKTITKINNIIRVVCASLLILMTAFVTFQVISRKMLNLSVSQVEELSRYCMIWVALFGSALGIINNSHVAVDMLIDKLKGKNRKMASIFVYIMMASLFIIFLYFRTKLSIQAMGQRSPSMTWLKMGFVMMCVPLTGLLGIVNIVSMIFKNLNNSELS